MPATLEVDSTFTDRHQATVPDTVRRALLTEVWPKGCACSELLPGYRFKA